MESKFHGIKSKKNSEVLGDIKGFIQLIPCIYKNDKPNNITGVDEIHLNCVCINDSIVIGIREPILYNFALDKPPGRKIHDEPKIKFFEKINKSVLSHISFFIGDDDRRPVNSDLETINFSCQLNKI